MAYRREIVHPPLNIDFEPPAAKHPSNRPNPESNSGSKPQPKRFVVRPPSPNSQITQKYAYELLMCEMELETTEQLTTEVTTRLFELYKVGVEHYNVKQEAQKESYFKRKLEQLANHPAVLGMLHSQKQSDDDNFYKKRQMERLLELNNHATENAETLIKRIECTELHNKQTVQRNLEKQVQGIKKRIERRRINSRANSVADDEDEKKERESDLDHKQPVKPKLNASFGAKRAYKSFVEADPLGTKEMIDKYFVQGFKEKR